MEPLIDHRGTVYQLLRNGVAALHGYAGMLWDGAGLAYVFLLCGLLLYAIRLKKQQRTDLRNQAAGDSAGGWLNYKAVRVVFVLILFVGLIILRLPVLGLGEQNPDESQWIACAATLVLDPRYWISVDGSTSGPLNLYPLTLIHYLGGHFDYATIRLVALFVCVVPTLALLLLALRKLYGDVIAALAVLPLAIALALTDEPDAVTYSSELISVLLLALAVWVGAGVLTKGPALPRLLALGLLLGGLPYAKLQSVPLGLWVAVWVVGWLVTRREARAKRLSQLGALLAGALLPTIVVMMYAWSVNSVEYAWRSYVLANLLYAAKGSWGGGAANWAERITHTLPAVYGWIPTLRVFLLGALAVAILGVVQLTKGKVDPANRYRLFFALGWLLVSVYATLQPGNAFPHYQILSYVPACSLMAAVLATYGSAFLGRWAMGWLAVMVVTPGTWAAVRGNHSFAEMAVPYQQPPLMAEVSRHAKPNESLVVWGWNNRVHVETGLVMGARFIPMYLPIFPNEQQPYFMHYLEQDLLTKRPKVIVDMSRVSREYRPYPPESYPSLWKLVQQQYRLTSVVDSVRIFVRQ